MAEMYTSVSSKQDLVFIGDLLMRRESSFDMRTPTEEDIVAKGLHGLASLICPNKSRIQEVLESVSFDSGCLVLDLLIHSWLNIPVTPMHCTKIICRIGIDNFCNDPRSLVDPK